MILLFSIPGGAETFFLLIIIWLIAMVAYLLMLRQLLKTISPGNRLVSPNVVWIVLFPLYAFFLHFALVFTLSASVRKEANERQLPISQQYPGLLEGSLMCMFNGFQLIHSYWLLSTTGFVVCWIIYWIRMNSYLNLFTRERPAES